MPKPSLAATITKQREQFPVTSKPGELSLLYSQAQYLVGLISEVPGKGAFAVHKTRLIAHLNPQIQEWAKNHQELMLEHALTEAVDSSNPGGERRALRYSAADELAKSIPEGEVVGAAKFASTEARDGFIKAFEDMCKELPVVIDTGASANLRKALTALHGALVGDACPLIEPGAVLMFERVIEEIETALSIEA